MTHRIPSKLEDLATPSDVPRLHAVQCPDPEATRSGKILERELRKPYWQGHSRHVN